MKRLDGDCIKSAYACNSAGYPQIKINGKSQGHHRVVYSKSRSLELIAIKDKIVRHLCNNPQCVNPSHLEIGTHQDNSNDMKSAGRVKITAKPKLTEEQVLKIQADKRYQKTIAKEYGVHPSTISNCIARKGAYK